MTSLFGSQITNCDRCGIRLKIADSHNPDSRLLRKSLTAQGVCANCCLTEWLQATEPINELLRSPRCRACGGRKYPTSVETFCGCQPPQFPSIGDMLMQPQIQQCIARLMDVGKSDATFGEIDWLEVVANWELKLPKRTKKRN